jgi:hypothetical protein
LVSRNHETVYSWPVPKAQVVIERKTHVRYGPPFGVALCSRPFQALGIDFREPDGVIRDNIGLIIEHELIIEHMAVARDRKYDHEAYSNTMRADVVHVITVGSHTSRE